MPKSLIGNAIMNSIKKLLLVSPSFFEINSSIEKSLLDLDVEVRLIDHAESSPSGLLGFLIFRVPKFFGLNFTTSLYDIYLNKKIIRVYKKFSPDALLVIKGDKVFVKTLEAIVSKKILWLMDALERTKLSSEQLTKYDSINFMEENDFRVLKSINQNSHFCPNCYDEKVYYNLGLEKEYDIVFVGALYKNRLEIFKNLISANKHLKIKIIGNFPSKFDYIRNISIFFKKNYFNSINIKKLTPNDTNIIYNKSKIVLNPHFNNSPSGTNMRFFEIIGSNSIQITNSKFYLKENYESLINSFEDESEIQALVTGILNDIDLFREKAIRATHKCIKIDTFKIRLSYILNYETRT